MQDDGRKGTDTISLFLTVPLEDDRIDLIVLSCWQNADGCPTELKSDFSGSNGVSSCQVMQSNASQRRTNSRDEGALVDVSISVLGECDKTREEK